MRVPSKSKNAAVRGPGGASATEAISSSSVHSRPGTAAAGSGLDTDGLPSGLGVQLVDGDHPREDVAELGGKGLAAPGELLATRVDQIEVRRELQRTREQLPRQRLRPVQPPLQEHLPAHAAALGEEV